MNISCNTFYERCRFCPSPNFFLCFPPPFCVPKKLTVCENVCEPCPQKRSFQKISSFPPLSALRNATNTSGNKAQSAAKSGNRKSVAKKLGKKVDLKKQSSKNCGDSKTLEKKMQNSQNKTENQNSNITSKEKNRSKSDRTSKNKNNLENTQGGYLDSLEKPTHIPSGVDSLTKALSSSSQDASRAVPVIGGKDDLNLISKEKESGAKNFASTSKEIGSVGQKFGKIQNKTEIENLKNERSVGEKFGKIKDKTEIGSLKNGDHMDGEQSRPQNGKSEFSSREGYQIKNLDQIPLPPCHPNYANYITRKQKICSARHQSCTAGHIPNCSDSMASIFRISNLSCISPNTCHLRKSTKNFPNGEIRKQSQIPLLPPSLVSYKVCNTCGTVKLNLDRIRQKGHSNLTKCVCMQVFPSGNKCVNPKR